ncbi:MAG: OsmC family protein [Bacteroidota bacterium]
MAIEVLETRWLEDMSFESEINGHKIILDADEAVGGKDRGPRPKPMILEALAGCTAMDVISLSKKMRVELDEFKVVVKGTVRDEHPKYFTHIHLQWVFTGKNMDHAKLEKACNLSKDRYCGVFYMLQKSSEITTEIIYNED